MVEDETMFWESIPELLRLPVRAAAVAMCRKAADSVSIEAWQHCQTCERPDGSVCLAINLYGDLALAAAIAIEDASHDLHTTQITVPAGATKIKVKRPAGPFTITVREADGHRVNNPVAMYEPVGDDLVSHLANPRDRELHATFMTQAG